MNHPIYKKVDQKEAEGEAWAFTDKDNISLYYFKLPELKEKEVLVRVTSSGLCMSDSHFGRGKWGERTYPVACGHEAIGVVTKLGSKVTKHKVGDKVMIGPFRNNCKKCVNCSNGRSNICKTMPFEERELYNKYWGGYSTHIHIDEEHAYKAPENIDLKIIPPVMCAGVTTFAPLFAHAKKGDKVAVVGMGGLGHFAV